MLLTILEGGVETRSLKTTDLEETLICYNVYEYVYIP